MVVELPLFPLNHVLLPSMPLPLHIFEPRYRQMLRDIGEASSGHGAFGVVTLQRGSEAGGPDAIPDVHRIGTVAEIIEIETNADGTSEVLAVGSRRFTVEALLPLGAPYLRARVTYLDETDGRVNPALLTLTRRLMNRYDAALMERTGRTTGAELPEDAAQLSYHLAARLPLGPLERQMLLGDTDAGTRLRRLVHLLRRETALLRSTGSIAVSPSVLRLAALPN